MRKLALVVAALLLSPSVSSVAGSSAAQAQPAVRGDWTADTQHTWPDADGEPRIQVSLRSSAGDNRWGFGIRLRDLAGLPPAAVSSVADSVQFSWTREAGVFRFTGSFNQGRGAGTYTFTADPAFASNMAVQSPGDAVDLAIHGPRWRKRR